MHAITSANTTTPETRGAGTQTTQLRPVCTLPCGRLWFALTDSNAATPRRWGGVASSKNYTVLGEE